MAGTRPVIMKLAKAGSSSMWRRPDDDKPTVTLTPSRPDHAAEVFVMPLPGRTDWNLAGQARGHQEA